MKQGHEDVEASAQLISKEDDNDIFDFEIDDSDDSEEPYSHWSRRYKSATSHLWRRIQPVPLPSWLPIHKLSQLNPRYIIFAFIISLVVTVFVFNPYESKTPSKTKTPPPSLGTSPETTDTYEPPKPVANDEFCTTWPVDDDGNYHHQANRSELLKLDSIAPAGGWQKPKGLKIIAMVFYGRKRYVDILDCYLQQNLASNGGYLDEVWFMAHTQDEDDIAWVKDLAQKNKDYKIVGLGDCDGDNKEYGCMWEYAVEDKTIYVKIDDDIVYIHQDAIPQLVHTRLAVPHAFAVSAQLVNSPITGLEQFHHNAIYPFVPDPVTDASHSASETWRLSVLPKYPKEKLESQKGTSKDRLFFPKVPYRGHPFVLLSEDNYDLLNTAMGRYDQDPGKVFIAFSALWKSWAMAAQQQYSLLYNLDKNQMSRYFFGTPARYPSDAKGPDAKTIVAAPKRKGKPVLGGEQIFDTQFRRYNLNFCAVWGSDIRQHLPMPADDEDAITASIPKRTGRPFIIDTRAVVGHFSFYTQAAEIRQTDLLDRYRAFANEAVCKPNNQKKPWDLRCPNFST